MEKLSYMQSASNLNLKYKFENFVVGESNEFDYKITKSVAENPSTKFNPLFIYGKAGLGKILQDPILFLTNITYVYLGGILMLRDNFCTYYYKEIYKSTTTRENASSDRCSNSCVDCFINYIIRPIFLFVLAFAFQVIDIVIFLIALIAEIFYPPMFGTLFLTLRQIKYFAGVSMCFQETCAMRKTKQEIMD